ncbi:MAG: VWA domain-containing protein [Deltaproteobacteria bacterium]|nr:VWA domain-containing protein [Deltaproteobacteria bacterium]
MGTLSAEQRELKVEQSDKVDAVLLLDASGSMRVTDPGRLRDEGAKLFTQFLKSGDRLAILSFSEEAQTIRPLEEYGAEQGEQVSKQIASVGNSGQFTNLLAGIKAAKDLLEKSKRDGASPAIILLSDGKMDPAPASGIAATLTTELLNTVLPDLKADGIKVHTLAFSDQTDQDLLAQIAVATEGAHYFTPNADKIHESFADLFVVVKKPQMLPLTSKGFKIDADVQEATFYVNGEEGAQLRIVSPSGKDIGPESRLPGFKWYKGTKFDVITIEKPEVGDWKVLGLPSTDGFATVLTNLKLVTDWPPSMNVGSPVLLQARLYESEKPVVLPEMTQAIRYAFQIVPTDRVSEPVLREGLFDDGTHGDKIANDGIFSYLVDLTEPGEYRLQIVAQAPTFERRQQIAFRVKPRVITLSVTSAEEDHAAAAAHAPSHSGPAKHDDHAKHDEHADAHGGGHADEKSSEPASAGSSSADSFLVELSEEAAGYRDIDIKVIAVDKNKRRISLPVIAAGSSTYRARAAALPNDGEYEVQATLNAEGKKKTRVRDVSNTISYTKVTLAGEEIIHVVEVEKTVEEPSASPILPILGLTLANLLGAGIGFLFIKRAQSQLSFKVPDFEPLDDLQAAIASLEAAAVLTEIDINDPRLSDEKLSAVVAPPAAAAAAPAPQAPAAQEPAPGGETPPSETSADGAAAGAEAPASEPGTNEAGEQ